MSLHHTPFKRLIEFFNQAKAVISQYGDTALTRLMLAGLEPYKSRGKGRGGHRQASKRCVAMAQRDARKARNRIKEKARR